MMGGGEVEGKLKKASRGLSKGTAVPGITLTPLRTASAEPYCAAPDFGICFVWQLRYY